MSLHLTGILLYTRNKTDYITHNYSSQTKVSATIFAPSRVYFYVPVNKKGRIKVQCSTLQPRGYTFIYPQTKRVTQNLGSFPTPSRVYFYTPATIRVHHTQLLHTTTWVYFYTPTNTEGYTKLRNFPHTLAGILLYTHRQGLMQHLEKSHTLAGILLCTRHLIEHTLLPPLRRSFRGSASDRGNLPLLRDRLPRLVYKPRNDVDVYLYNHRHRGNLSSHVNKPTADLAK